MNFFKLLLLLSCGVSVNSFSLFAAAAAEKSKEEIMKSHSFSYRKENMAFAPNLYQRSQPMQDEILRSFQEITPLDSLINKGFYVQSHPVSLKEVHDLLTASVNNEHLLEYLKCLSIEQLLKAFHLSENLAINNNSGAVKESIKDYIDTIPGASLDEAVFAESLAPRVFEFQGSQLPFTHKLYQLSKFMEHAAEDIKAETISLNNLGDMYYIKVLGVTLQEIHGLLSAVSDGHEQLLTFLNSLAMPQLLKMLEISSYLDIQKGTKDTMNSIINHRAKDTTETIALCIFGKTIEHPAIIKAVDGGIKKLESEFNRDLIALLKRIFDAHRFIILAGHTEPVSCIAFSPDSRFIASSSANKNLWIWNLATEKLLFTLKNHTDQVESLALSPDATYTASGSVSGDITIWNNATGEFKLLREAHIGPVKQLAFSPDGTMLASSGNGYDVSLWSSSTGKKIRDIKNFEWNDKKVGVARIAFNTDSKILACSSANNSIYISDTISGELLGKLIGHRAEVRSIAFSIDGKQIISSSYDKKIIIWDTCNQTVLKSIVGSISLTLSPDGLRFASVSLGGNISITIIPSAEELLAKMLALAQIELPLKPKPLEAESSAAAAGKDSADDQMAQDLQNHAKEEISPKAIA